MSSQRPHGGLTLFLLLSCFRVCLAVAPAPLTPVPAPAQASPQPVQAPISSAPGFYTAPANPAINGVGDDSTAGALRALPVDNSPDASTHRKFYTLSATLREIYDGNVSTSNSNQRTSYETALSPTVLVDFPTTDGDFTGRYTLGITYYSYGPQNNGNGSSSNATTGNQSSLELTHEVVAQYNRSLSERFNVALSEDFRDQTEPGILQSTGTNYQSGPYISNAINGSLGAQWTPLVNSSFSAANTIVRYQDTDIGDNQNSVETTGTGSVGYALLPKINTSVGVLLDNITYETADRGYTTYTGFFGVGWTALPSLSLSARAGGTYSMFEGGQSSIDPYGALTVNWTLGARSSLSFAYTHEVTPSDQIDANGSTSDRLSAGFRYQITPRLSSHLDGIYTLSTVPNAFTTTDGSTGNGYKENVYDIETGLEYTYTANVAFDFGLALSGVDSNNDNNNYTRDEAYIGVRGTY